MERTERNNETSTRRGLTRRVIEGIRYPPKSGEMRDRGVGGGHSTDDGEDNRTLPEGRTSASAMLSMKRHCVIAKAQNMPLDKVRVLQRKLYLAAKTNPKRKFGVLYDKVCREDVLRAAYAQVRANRGAPGIDQQSFEIIEKEIGVDAFLSEIQRSSLRKRYKPLPVRRVYIPKADGTQRPLGIPVITDRVVQAAVKIVIEPLFEAIFKDFSYGFRPRKSAHQALREVYKWLNFRCHWVVDADLKSYFDTIPHDNLLLSVRSRVIDRSVVKLIEMWLKAGVMEEMQVRKETTGTPQGGVISPLLANLYLHWLDQTGKDKGFGERRTMPTS